MNINIVYKNNQPAGYPMPNEVQYQINVPVNEYKVCNITFKAMESVPNNYFVVKSANNNNFSSINDAKLDVLDIFETDVIINNNVMNSRFYIVPNNINNTILASAILGSIN